MSTFTRIITYSILIGTCYTLAMGLKFGLLAGLALGTALGLHLDRLGKGKADSKRFILLISALRSIGLSAAVLSTGHPKAALVVAILVLIASMLLPVFNVSPALILENNRRPSFNWTKLGLALGFGAIALVADFIVIYLGLASSQNLHIMLRVSCTVVMATLITATISPMIEWYADNVEAKVLGYIGAVMFIIGFFIQALPSLIVLLN
ncbi:MAG: hypothetical protein K2X27_13830 [Candidatus Obscuribacterales bacterium]|nr:hypothetical protein [Candidatus Obscuribacterales bacterium]